MPLPLASEEVLDHSTVLADLDAWIKKQPSLRDSHGLPTIHVVLTARALLSMLIEREKERLV